MNQYSMSNKIRFRLLTDFKTMLKEKKTIFFPNIGKKCLQSFKDCLAFPEKWFCFRWSKLTLWNLEQILHSSEDSMKAFGRLPNKFIRNFNISFSLNYNSILGVWKFLCEVLEWSFLSGVCVREYIIFFVIQKIYKENLSRDQ